MIRTVPHAAVSIMRTAGADHEVPLPAYQSDNAAGMDIRTNLKPEMRTTGLIILPGARVLVPTGLSVAIPQGYEMQIRPRSGLALKHGITLVNSPGTVDADYRGEIGVIVINHGDQPLTIAHGERIAQLVLAPVVHVTWEIVGDLSATRRGFGGFGSTGS